MGLHVFGWLRALPQAWDRGSPVQSAGSYKKPCLVPGLSLHDGGRRGWEEEEAPPATWPELLELRGGLGL